MMTLIAGTRLYQIEATTVRIATFARRISSHCIGFVSLRLLLRRLLQELISERAGAVYHIAVTALEHLLRKLSIEVILSPPRHGIATAVCGVVVTVASTLRMQHATTTVQSIAAVHLVLQQRINVGLVVVVFVVLTDVVVLQPIVRSFVWNACAVVVRSTQSIAAIVIHMVIAAVQGAALVAR